jgi:hypothetical protein
MRPRMRSSYASYGRGSEHRAAMHTANWIRSNTKGFASRRVEGAGLGNITGVAYQTLVASKIVMACFDP